MDRAEADHRDPAYVVADLGATNLRVARLAADLSVVERSRRPTPATAGEQLDALLAGLARLGAADASAVAVGVAARVRWPAGHVESGGILALRDVPLARLLSRRFGTSCVVDNDANLAALAEARIGAASRAATAVTVTLGSGVGGGITRNGELFRGGSFAAEVGHLPVFGDPECGCGQTGCWETRASGRALGQRLCGGPADAALAAASAGDRAALDVILDWARSLRRGLQAIRAMLDPDLVVLGGGLGTAGASALDLAHRHRPPRYDLPPVAAARFGDDAGLLGGALLARRTLAGRCPGSRGPSPGSRSG